MQRDNRGTTASLTPQIGLPRPSSTWDLHGSAQTTARPTDDGALPCKSQVAGWSWQADLGRQGGYCASIILLHAGLVHLLSFYYPLIMLLHGVI